MCAAQSIPKLNACPPFRSSWKSTQSVALLRHNRTCTERDDLKSHTRRARKNYTEDTKSLKRDRRGPRCIKVEEERDASRPGTSMGRKRWWHGGSELLVLFILHHVILGDGDVGCLFSESLCNPQTETCFNDLAFGKCLPLYADLNDEDYYQYDFNVDELELLRLQLERLEIDGYKWAHPYAQCIMQTSLYNLRHGENYDLRLCQHHMQRTRYENDNAIDQARVPAIAIVKFTPNNGNSGNQFASELYYPPGTPNQYITDTFYNDEFPQSSYNEQPRESASRVDRPRYDSNTYNEYTSLTNEKNYEDLESKLRQKLVSFDGVDDRLYRTRRQPYGIRDYNDDVIESIKSALNQDAKEKFTDDRGPSAIDTLPVQELEFLISEKPSSDYFNKKQTGDDLDVEYEKAFSRKYKHPRKFTELLDKDELLLENVKRNSKDDDYVNNDYDDVGAEIELPQRDTSSMENAMYTEGGLVQAVSDKSDSDGDENTYDALFDDDLNEFLWRRELAGFKRRERLDVKKPGPPFSTNNYAFKTPSPPTVEDENRSDSSEAEQDKEVLYVPFVKKELKTEHQPESSSRSYDNVDLDYVYMEFRQPFHTWSEGEHVVTEVGKLLGLSTGTLKDIRVGRAEVTFKVVDNNKNYNATDVVSKIDDIRGKLQESLSVDVIRAGIGDKAKLPATLEVAGVSSVFGALVAAGVAAAGAAAVVTLVIARRHAKSRAKLAGLSTPDPEASKDYQDLCRARMQAKQPTDKPESPRVTNLSRESESNNLPSNRSSTSSWGEEAALSNMDISTGQMVLSYMEDHLQNKDRLDEEWAALCVYEVDSCSTDIAESEANIKCNRPGASLPYDHSRVILNDLANANNSDYINASTITDHDPRNPAYIATQGPLPHTTADFWQLVWEQGSVVIVMLTRLTEEGVGMCHRYWPEKGSELYHIYEVHLVSEHFWCDDYLVRSFYLKNLRTGETRTVTQFHFLSWPENGVPYSTKALLEFRRKINKSYKGRSCPIVVHCSDGVGRTGTYCLIDMVLNRMMKGAKEIDIAATLEHIRDQRPDMVATKQQFEFVLMAVAEEVHAILKALPAPPADKSLTGSNSSSKESQ
ncbi:receptor-type tyrosine-protein phosphatase N2 isoform X2 [Colletes gigas]|uniref:receptor-type tyrosine-protein phosphatase N2 isoform X2 n=1 Tax=Colletes gigas TaxID=935657 RepID=UPI001C9BA635|nr:receptor-type tyrosine-protein phosphatase N2 isoform X2 [Colletes gigas]